MRGLVQCPLFAGCYAPCSSDTDGCQPTCLRSDPVGPPSATLRTPRTVLHNLSRDTGDLFTSLSFLLYLLIFPMPRSDYLPHVFLMFSLIYFRSSSGSSINSSAIVGSTQTKIPVPSSCKPSLVSPTTPTTTSKFLLIGLGRLLSPDRFRVGNHWSLSVTFGTHR